MSTNVVGGRIGQLAAEAERGQRRRAHRDASTASALRSLAETVSTALQHGRYKQPRNSDKSTATTATAASTATSTTASTTASATAPAPAATATATATTSTATYSTTTVSATTTTTSAATTPTTDATAASIEHAKWSNRDRLSEQQSSLTQTHI